ncbi:MAG: hypothetical protein V3T72_20300 [Thermoanaerobaculia bacterium]
MKDGIATEGAAVVAAEATRGIHRLQQEICDREERISALVDAVERPLPLSDRMAAGDSRRRLEHIERLITDWDTLVARSRAISEDDIDLIAALARLVGRLLQEQPEGIGERWIFKLREYLDDQRSKVS